MDRQPATEQPRNQRPSPSGRRILCELLIDLEEDKAAPTVVLGLLPEMRGDAKQLLWCETTG
jgi:hypothetical protein